MSDTSDAGTYRCSACGEAHDGVHDCPEMGDRIADPVEYGDRLAGAVATMDGEADELAARRPHRDAHLYHVEEGLRLRASQLDSWLEEAYYR